MSVNRALSGSLVVIFLAFLAFFVLQDSGTKEGSVAVKNFHASMYYFDNADFFPESVKAFSNVKPLTPAPHIFIVNQHILAAHLIAQQFAMSADPNVKTVVVITQNNWDAGRSPIITSNYDWKTPFGNIKASSTLINSLIRERLASPEEDIFTTEHGITGIVPYIAHSFPNAAIVPLVIRDKTSNEIVDALASVLSKLDLSTTAIIGTIDMSHYLPEYIADAHDRLTVQTIKGFNYEALPRLDIDTTPTLRVILKVAESVGYGSFMQTGGINSAEIVKDPELMETTSYITGYFKKGEKEKTDPATHMLFVGDMMFDRGIAMHADKYGIKTLFSKVERLFLGTNLVIGNLEGTITHNKSIAEKDYSILHFTFDPMFAQLLSDHGFFAVSLANNHTLDFYEAGYVDTMDNLKAAGIDPFGSPRNDEHLSTKIQVQGKTICLVGYHDLYVPNSSTAEREIERIRPECSYIVLFAHWGIEYQKSISERQKMLAHRFIDAGADLVIGAHPHVVEPIEIYKDKAIFYSLGNFIFDQNLNFDTEHGLAVNVEWNNDKTIFTLVPTSLNKGEVSIANPQDRQKVLSSAVNKASISDEVRSDIMKTSIFTIWNHNNQTSSSQ